MKPCSYTSRVIVVHYGGFPQSYKIPHKIGSKRGEIPIFTIQSLFTCHYSSVTIHLSLFTVTIHLSLFMTLFTPNFAYLSGVVPYV